MVFNLLLRFVWVGLNTKQLDSDSLELLESKLTSTNDFRTNHRKPSVHM